MRNWLEFDGFFSFFVVRPSLRGSTPLDVAYSSVMDNTELALALREHYLEKIAVYLSRCGLQSNSELLSKVNEKQSKTFQPFTHSIDIYKEHQENWRRSPKESQKSNDHLNSMKLK